MSADSLPFTVYPIPGLPPLAIVPAPRDRDWLTDIGRLCVPMMVANASAWHVLNDVAFTATWDGSDRPDAVRIASDGTPSAEPRFGPGCVAWTLPFIFRLPDGWNLLIRAPANFWLDGATCHEGLLEADHASCTASAVWRLTRPGTVAFPAGMPIAALVPQRRGELAAFAPEIRDLRDDDATYDNYREWRIGRQQLLAEMAGVRAEDVRPRDLSRAYLRDARLPRLHLRPFA